MKKYLMLVLVVLVLSTIAWTQMEAIETTPQDSGEAVLEGKAELETPAEPAEGVEDLILDDGKILQSCTPECVEACQDEEAECKAGCNGNFQCQIACSCAKYWCVDACPCEQDPPPILC